MDASVSAIIFYMQFWYSEKSCCKYWRRQWHPTPVLLPGKSHGQRSVVGCSPWGLVESDTTERLHFHFSLSCIGEGNGNPLQCSCLENPRDGGAWWAAVYGISQSRTWLKWLSSSSCKYNKIKENRVRCRLLKYIQFPGSPVVKTLIFHSQGCESNPQTGN